MRRHKRNSYTLTNCKPMNNFFKKSDYLILSAALLSMFASILIWFMGYREEGLFIGIWVPSILAFGVYFKLTIIQARRSP